MPLISKKLVCHKASEMEFHSTTKCNQGKQSQQRRGKMDKEMIYWCEFYLLKVGFSKLINNLSFMRI